MWEGGAARLLPIPIGAREMKSVRQAITSVFGRLIVSSLVLVAIVVVVFLGMLVGGDRGAKPFVYIAFYGLCAWTLMPLVLCNVTTTVISALLWLGLGIHAYVFVTTFYTSNIFIYWSFVSFVLLLAILVKYNRLHANQLDQQTTEKSNPQTHDLP